MDKNTLHPLIIERLQADLELAQRAAQSAYEAATDEQNIAENKYDTLGLEASYLATGQARRAQEIRQSLSAWQQLTLRPFDPRQGIQLGALVWLADAREREQCLLLGPEGAGLRLQWQGQEVLLVSPRAPLGQRLLGCGPGDEVELRIAGGVQHFEILRVL
ncbi:GreA/GreB family elongation factor [Pseudomonas sp. LPB0260]|uniref:GreA/GreB family elongation factor n=1 Tax=Pseudomonas sp. LPB0260 TaxID=2614442 RepID=UPI0015C2718A|nr:GreA/GreB family elongation factor [Pseudomonas sp. LPB0260]QLC72769.1 GreA/GreB family elongation factor [Pseudomonas sp. LPB0260]QLC75543.1 GreA/GreB family elongation factor [Pseudomonas sp. LPB0260]